MLKGALALKKNRESSHSPFHLLLFKKQTFIVFVCAWVQRGIKNELRYGTQFVRSSYTNNRRINKFLSTNAHLHKESCKKDMAKPPRSMLVLILEEKRRETSKPRDRDNS